MNLFIIKLLFPDFLAKFLFVDFLFPHFGSYFLLDGNRFKIIFQDFFFPLLVLLGGSLREPIKTLFELLFVQLVANFPSGKIISGVNSRVYDLLSFLGWGVVEKPQLDFDEFPFVRFLQKWVFGDGDTLIPLLFSEPEQVLVREGIPRL